jgi:hypothetical protein
MTDRSGQKRVPLAAEDLARVRRLTEEVKSRLYEMGLIMGRTLGHDIPPGTLVKYEPRQSTEQADQTVEVVVMTLPDGTVCCAQDPPGECVCPC